MNLKAILLLTSLLLGSEHLSAQKLAPLYMPLGDSYTIGEGLPEDGRFPNQLVELLKKSGIEFRLGPNPARTGWTTQNLIDEELPLFKKTKPQFATLLIGVNDWVQKVPTETFRANFKYIVQEMLRVLPSKLNLVIVTIPDFSATPQGKKYSGGRDISAGIAEFNDIIKKESDQIGVKVVDIYYTTQQMKRDRSLIAEDGLHPSAAEYKLWAEMIAPHFIKFH